MTSGPRHRYLLPGTAACRARGRYDGSGFPVSRPRVRLAAAHPTSAPYFVTHFVACSRPGSARIAADPGGQRASGARSRAT
jgi:hypothetical protein